MAGFIYLKELAYRIMEVAKFNMQSKSAGWRFREEMKFQLESEDSVEAEFPLWGISVCSLQAFY